MAVTDRDIERLYQLPLAEFTSARNALEATAGSQKAAIRQLQKPSLPAWSVNQLFWHHKRVYEALVAAAQKLRAAQVAAISGKQADVGRAEVAHAAARKAAAEQAREILHAAGEPATSATMTAVQETLDALPIDQPPGRLTRPLKPMGFAGLAGLLHASPVAHRRAAVLPFRPPQTSRQTPASETHARHAEKAAAAEEKRALLTAKHEAEAREREAKKLADELREIKASERAVLARLASARTALAKAKNAHETLAEQLKTEATRVGELEQRVSELEKTSSESEKARARLETRLKDLD